MAQNLANLCHVGRFPIYPVAIRAGGEALLRLVDVGPDFSPDILLGDRNKQRIAFDAAGKRPGLSVQFRKPAKQLLDLIGQVVLAVDSTAIAVPPWIFSHSCHELKSPGDFRR